MGGRGDRTAGGPDRARPSAVCVFACVGPGRGRRRRRRLHGRWARRGVGERIRPDRWPGDDAGRRVRVRVAVWSARRAAVGKSLERPIVNGPQPFGGGKPGPDAKSVVPGLRPGVRRAGDDGRPRRDCSGSVYGYGAKRKTESSPSCRGSARASGASRAGTYHGGAPRAAAECGNAGAGFSCVCHSVNGSGRRIGAHERAPRARRQHLAGRVVCVPARRSRVGDRLRRRPWRCCRDGEHSDERVFPKYGRSAVGLDRM